MGMDRFRGTDPRNRPEIRRLPVPRVTRELLVELQKQLPVEEYTLGDSIEKVAQNSGIKKVYDLLEKWVQEHELRGQYATTI